MTSSYGFYTVIEINENFSNYIPNKFHIFNSLSEIKKLDTLIVSFEKKRSRRNWNLWVRSRHTHLEKLPVLGLGFRCYLIPKPKPKT